MNDEVKALKFTMFGDNYGNKCQFHDRLKLPYYLKLYFKNNDVTDLHALVGSDYQVTYFNTKDVKEIKKKHKR